MAQATTTDVTDAFDHIDSAETENSDLAEMDRLWDDAKRVEKAG